MRQEVAAYEKGGVTKILLLDAVLERFTKDELLQEAECVEEYGEWMHMSLIGYSAEELRKYAEEHKSNE